LDRLWKNVVCLLVSLTAVCLSNRSLADPVRVPSLPVPMCGITSAPSKSNQLALRQYLTHFNRTDLDESSLEPRLGLDGTPCIRPAVRNTSVKLIHRVVELGYAEWNPLSGMLDLDTWTINLLHGIQFIDVAIDKRSVAVTVHAQVRQTRFKFPWMHITAASFIVIAALLLLQLGRLSSLMIRRTSIAGLGSSEARTKVRGIAIPTIEALQVAQTDIQAVAYRCTTAKYDHKGWRTTGRDSEQVSISIDDGTGCIDVDLTHANVHFSNQVGIYNGIPGEHSRRTPYLDDTNIVFEYIPVGAVVTLIGTLFPHDTCFRAMKNVHVYDGDERGEVHRLKFRVFLCIGVLLVLSILMFVLRPSR